LENDLDIKFAAYRKLGVLYLSVLGNGRITGVSLLSLYIYYSIVEIEIDVGEISTFSIHF